MGAVALQQIGVSRSKTVAAGTMVMGFWAQNQPAPAAEALKAALADYGETWVIGVLDFYPHVGVTLSETRSEYELAVHFAQANAGKAAYVGAVIGDETVLDRQRALEELGEEARDIVYKTVETGLNSANTALSWAKYAPWVIGALLLVAVALVLWFAVRKVKKA